MKRNKLINGILCIAISAIVINSCKKEEPQAPENPAPGPSNTTPAGTTYIQPNAQRTNGNAALGEDFIKNGNFAFAGIPYPQFPYSSNTNELNRTGHNATIPYSYTEVDAFNGVKVVAPNCLTCHATYLNNQFIIGLGNTIQDFTTDASANIPLIDSYISNAYGGTQSPEYQAYEPFSTGMKALGPYTITKTKGANPANKYAYILAAHRNAADFEWQETASTTITTDVVATDVPAWWLLKKKNALYFNANGEGDWVKTIMSSSLLTVKDTSYARMVDGHFVDVLAYLKTIEPPTYTEPINSTDAEAGKAIFVANCSKCHGTYGTTETYPNLLVDLDTIQTDPLLITAQMASTFFTSWYNQSWFGTGANPGRIAPKHGYIAPPLDGVWATAPYLHNGSVPDLYTLLKSSARPTYWTRTFSTTDYNFTNVGWNYSTLSNPDATCYNTQLAGYNNTGHKFGDHLNDSDRMKLIEYLKTL
jgi:cytochrome c2